MISGILSLVEGIDNPFAIEQEVLVGQDLTDAEESQFFQLIDALHAILFQQGGDEDVAQGYIITGIEELVLSDGSFLSQVEDMVAAELVRSCSPLVVRLLHLKGDDTMLVVKDRIRDAFVIGIEAFSGGKTLVVMVQHFILHHFIGCHS